MKKRGESYYWNAREKIQNRLSQLPRGTIKERLISGRKYYYFQRREGKKVVHTYIGKEIPKDLEKEMLEREELRAELRRIQEVLTTFLADKIRGLLK